MPQLARTRLAPSAQPSSPLKKARSAPLGERTSEEPRVHDHVRLYSSASPSLKSTKGALALPSGTERIAGALLAKSVRSKKKNENSSLTQNL